MGTCINTTQILAHMGANPGSKSIRLYRNCYIYPLKWGTWVLAQDITVGACGGGGGGGGGRGKGEGGGRGA